MLTHLIQTRGGKRMEIVILETKDDGMVVAPKEGKAFLLKWDQFSFVINPRHV